MIKFGKILEESLVLESMYRNDPIVIKAKYDSKCVETGKSIKRGEEMVYFPKTKRTYCMDSRTAKEWLSQHVADNMFLGDRGW